MTVIAPTVISTAQGALLKSARERMNIISAYHQVGTYRGAAELCGTTHKTVKRVIERAEAGGQPPREPRPRNLDAFTDLVAIRVDKSNGKISAKRLLPVARAAGYDGSARNFRRLVAEQKVLWRKQNRHQRRPAVWSPGDYLVVDWAEAAPGLFVFCAVLAYSRWRFVRFAADQKASTTLAMIGEALEAIGGVPAKILADRMGCLKRWCRRQYRCPDTRLRPAPFVGLRSAQGLAALRSGGNVTVANWALGARGFRGESVRRCRVVLDWAIRRAGAVRQLRIQARRTSWTNKEPPHRGITVTVTN